MAVTRQADGFLNVDKPAGITSREVVDRVVRAVGVKRVGHAGSLDPMATGVLVVAVGRATRLIEYVQRMPKTYDATFQLGRVSDTDDVEGQVIEVAGAAPPDRDRVRAALAKFVGRIMQFPPRVSALKVRGRRAYELARKGKAVALAPRPVDVFEIALLDYSYPSVDVRVVCGSGTYIRALARDLGRELEIGGLMSRLRRTAVGTFHAPDAVAPDDLQRNWAERLLPLSAAVGSLPRVVVEEAECARFRLGQACHVRDEVPAARETAVFTVDGRFVGIGVADPDRGVVHPSKVLG